MTKQLKSVELFLAIGLVTTMGASSGATVYHQSQDQESVSTLETIKMASEHGHGHSKQGGEAGEGGGSSGDPDVDYMTALALMQGHLIVAEELIEAGEYDQAEPHIGHPVEELYGDVEEQLADRNVPQFDTTLNELHDLVKFDPQSARLRTRFQTSVRAIDGAMMAVPKDLRESPEFVLEVIGRVLETAAAEYEAAIANNRFVEIIEYQDSRGFVIYANELYATIADTMKRSRPDDHQVILESLQELQTIWPSVNPPNTPLAEPSKVFSLVFLIGDHS
ncbi:hypothetical protein [Roseofilum sp. Guam]|uniref:hypothetical protein n=1 Tax=Roseofilum sp. Guam TaxID=2821502 RepID=UPI001B259B5F|nr:hypothetical protein [Roseofilum sp. Guam]MBP0028396.1 hypothetical protein [Roseofilum sp. Guam]